MTRRESQRVFHFFLQFFVEGYNFLAETLFAETEKTLFAALI